MNNPNFIKAGQTEKASKSTDDTTQDTTDKKDAFSAADMFSFLSTDCADDVSLSLIDTGNFLCTMYITVHLLP